MRRILTTTCLLALIVSTGNAQNTLVINHDSGTATFKNRKFVNGDRIRANGTVKVKVTRTNSAAYTCTVETEEIKVPEVEAGTAFLAGLSSYLQELVPVIAERAGPPSDAKGKVQSALRNVDKAMVGPLGLRSAVTLTLEALDKVRGSLPLNDALLSDYRKNINEHCNAGCSQLKATGDLVRALVELSNAVAELQVSGPSPDTKDLFAVAVAVLAKADEMMAFAYGSEKLVSKTFKATSEIECPDDVPVELNKGFKTTIKVLPSTIPGLQRVATSDPYEATFEIQPDWFFRPTVGLSLLYASDATYPTYGTKERTDGSFDIREAGSVNNRIAYGLTLSATWRFLDWRDDKKIALYLPELTVNPSDDVKSVALGGAISISFLKIGVGMLWTKHTTLSNGQTVGAVIADPEELSTRERYGRGKQYVSFSLVGLPPFLP